MRIVQITHAPVFHGVTTNRLMPINRIKVGQYAIVLEEGTLDSLLIMDSGDLEYVSNHCLLTIAGAQADMRARWWKSATNMYMGDEDEALQQYASFVNAYKQRLKNSGKTCTRCNEFKPLSEFGKQNATPDGLKNVCKECKSVENAERYRLKQAKAI